MGESFLNRIIQSGSPTPPTPSGYVRLAGVPDGESIITNAPVIENEGTNYYPIYYMCLMDTVASESFTKTGAGVSTGADAYVFSDDLSNFYVGDTTHTFDVSQDSETSEGWKCRYVIAYATEANKDKFYGISVNLNSIKSPFEFIGSQYLTLSGALFGISSGTHTIKYINLSNSSFYNDTISSLYFCNYCYSLESLLLPYVTTISSNGFCKACSSLKSLSLPYVTTISGTGFCEACSSLKSLSLPSVTTISGNYFLGYCYGLESLLLPSVTTISSVGFLERCYGLESLSLPIVATINLSGFLEYCYQVKYFEIPNTVTSITETSVHTLNYTRYIKLTQDFDFDGCNFTGATGYTKSITWFTHLATQLKDNSGGTAKTMVLGAANIALIPSAQATIISNKNWTLS